MSERVEVSRCRNRAEARQQALVLVAVGIACQLQEDEGGVALFVEADDALRAEWELDSYREENRRAPLVTTAQRLGLLTGPRAEVDAAGARVLPSPPLLGVIGYVLVLLAGFGAQNRQPFGLDWTQLGAVDAGAILNGAVWRAATGLTLHANLGHLLSNLVFGSVCGLLVGRQFGTGLAWLALVLAGTLGNLLNALFQDPGHVAIGASTAVFGGLGFLAGAAQSARELRWRQGLRRWSPVAAGIMLVAFLGVGGERTDVGGHVAGFLAGIALGLGAAYLPERLCTNRWVQSGCALVALGGLAIAWLVAVA
ncbi:rhomboid family intramembrane serine protease [Rhodovibrio salinarum]|uniref:Rhomboid family intramembrane serine protease n=1 Tax=Rhodovibrio salinarum TaxID=1087 RepID=A0A934V0R3_9PROT|nr:rhomboid family intramembrane serine protease [Rhodovibrio salinarum]MBK1697916.1 rhomboid family intramembrane serine protease [Rhodovibrio salinarum]